MLELTMWEQAFLSALTGTARDVGRASSTNEEDFYAVNRAERIADIAEKRMDARRRAQDKPTPTPAPGGGRR